MKKNSNTDQSLELKEGLIIKTIMNNSEDTIYFKNLESRFILNSKAHAIQFKETEVKNLIGKNDFDYFPNEFSQAAYDTEQNIIKAGQAQIGIIEKWIKPNGEIIWFSASKYPLYDENDKIIGTWGTSRDITPLKNAEEQLLSLNKKLTEVNQQLEFLSTRDGLSGLYNHRHFYESLNIARAQCNRHKESGVDLIFSVLLLDLDHFKPINDTYGHQIGDMVIKKISEYLVNSTRLADLVFRVGGDEFAILAMNTSHEAALILAEKLRSIIEKSEIDIGEVKVKMTTSIGVVSSNEKDLISDLIALGDSRLYFSKQNGRNRIS